MLKSKEAFITRNSNRGQTLWVSDEKLLQNFSKQQAARSNEEIYGVPLCMYFL